MTEPSDAAEVMTAVPYDPRMTLPIMHAMINRVSSGLLPATFPDFMRLVNPTLFTPLRADQITKIPKLDIRTSGTRATSENRQAIKLEGAAANKTMNHPRGIKLSHDLSPMSLYVEIMANRTSTENSRSSNTPRARY